MSSKRELSSDAADVDKIRSVRQKLARIQSNLTEYAENLFEAEFGLDDVDDVTIDELRHIYTKYKQSLTSMTLEAGQSFGNSTTQEEVDKFEYTTDDATVYNYLQHYLDKLDEQREHYAGSSADTELHTSSSNTSGGSGAGIGLSSDPFPAPVSPVRKKPELDTSFEDYTTDSDSSNVNLDFSSHNDFTRPDDKDDEDVPSTSAQDTEQLQQIQGVHLRFHA